MNTEFKSKSSQQQTPPSPVEAKVVDHSSGSHRTANHVCMPDAPVHGPVKPHAFLKPRAPFKLGTFNVRTLLQPGQQAGLAQTLDDFQVDICCISETRLQDSSEAMLLRSPSNQKARFHLRLSGDQAAASMGRAGVGIVLSSRAESALLDWIPVNSRLCAVRLQGSCRINRFRPATRNLFVISAYAPTDCSVEEDKDQFYQCLNDLLRQAPRQDVVILAGDLNARVGRLSQCEKHLGGHHGMDNVRNDNGERLLDLCTTHRLFLTSTNFRHSKLRSATWRPPTPRQSMTQIDHVAISYRWRGSVQDCRSHWSTCVETDHALVCAKISLQFGGPPKPIAPSIDFNKLLEPEVRHNFQAVLNTKLSGALPDDIEGRWSVIQHAMLSAAQESCGPSRIVVKSWMSEDSIKLLNERRYIPPGSEFNTDRRILCQKLRRSLRSDKEKWWSNRAREMEEAASCGNTRKLFRLIHATGPKRKGVSETILDQNGSAITNQQQRLDRWAEHFSVQFNQPPAATLQQEETVTSPWDMRLEPPDETEIRRAIRNLKRFKAAGSDNIPPALFKDSENVIVKELVSLFSKIWLEERVPSLWGESIIIPVFKKGSQTMCTNYRGISLIPVASKLLASILLQRLSPVRELHYREEQAGFRRNRGCCDHIFTLRQILEHRHTYRRPTCVVFLDIKGAFDSLDRRALWNCLLRNGVPKKYVSILQGIYQQTTGKVRAYGKLSPSVSFASGVRQGCPMSPFLFNFVMDSIIQAALDGSWETGVQLLPGDRITDLEYADDIALLGENASAVQLSLDRLVCEASKYGLQFAPSKSQVLLQDWQGPVPDLTLAGDHLDVVNCFVYLGSCVSDGGSIDLEITRRIAKARSAFSNLQHLWRRRDVSLALKGRVYNATVRAVLLYGCETWPLRVEDMRKLTVFDHRCLRRILRVRWEHRMSNDEVRRRIFGEDSLSLEKIISLSRLRWLGHVLRMSPQRLPRRALFAFAGEDWRKPQGGQTLTWRSSMKKQTEKLAIVGRSRLPGWDRKSKENEWLETLSTMAKDRNQWRQCCFNLLHPP